MKIKLEMTKGEIINMNDRYVITENDRPKRKISVFCTWSKRDVLIFIKKSIQSKLKENYFALV